MKKLPLILTLTLILAILLGGCSPASTPTAAPTETVQVMPTPTPLPPTSTPVPTPEPTEPPAEILLELTGPNGSKGLTLADLQALPPSQGQAGMKSSTGKITVPALYSGVALQDLASLVADMDESMGINVVAEDGYAMTFSYNQVTKGEFITYDPATGDEKKMNEDLTVIVAYQREGEALDANGEGRLRLAIISPKNNQVTDGHWSVKWVSKLEVKPLGKEWSLKMNGAIEDLVDRNSFQSCGAPGCHQASWTDESAQVWAGVPLWLLVGRVDDAIKHDGPAYFEALADAGYVIEIIATDGYSVTLDSVRVKRNNDILVAYQVNDNPLPDKYFPLRLVGTDLQKNEMVGTIDQIKLVIDPALVPTPAETMTPTVAAAAPAVPAGTDLAVDGLVQTPLYLKEADLRAMEVVKLTAEHPKKGSTEYEGVRLVTLLMQAGVQAGAKTLRLTASDGYAIDVDLAAVQACSDCLVAFSDTPGLFVLVMPGMESSLWVKEIVHIEVK